MAGGVLGGARFMTMSWLFEMRVSLLGGTEGLVEPEPAGVCVFVSRTGELVWLAVSRYCDDAGDEDDFEDFEGEDMIFCDNKRVSDTPRAGTGVTYDIPCV